MKIKPQQNMILYKFMKKNNKKNIENYQQYDQKSEILTVCEKNMKKVQNFINL